MAAKDDILEQIVEEYLIDQGYFVQHNVKFIPDKDHPDYVKSQDSNHSDIDVLGYNPNLEGPERVYAVSFKSWAAGFSPATVIAAIDNDKNLGGKEAWKSFRELCRPKLVGGLRQGGKGCDWNRGIHLCAGCRQGPEEQVGLGEQEVVPAGHGRQSAEDIDVWGHVGGYPVKRGRNTCPVRSRQADSGVSRGRNRNRADNLRLPTPLPQFPRLSRLIPQGVRLAFFG